MAQASMVCFLGLNRVKIKMNQAVRYKQQ